MQDGGRRAGGILRRQLSKGIVNVNRRRPVGNGLLHPLAIRVVAVIHARLRAGIVALRLPPFGVVPE